ncbi:hypothetical protein M495_24105 [Serratia liquefaciens ATCC 27592]|nr:hypothetical protein M495_24105 [Serratia liquefaciens ATCC 27592]
MVFLSMVYTASMTKMAPIKARREEGVKDLAPLSLTDKKAVRYSA